MKKKIVGPNTVPSFLCTLIPRHSTRLISFVFLLSSSTYETLQTVRPHKQNIIPANFALKANKLHGLSGELYRPSDRRLSAKLCQLLRIEGVAWSA
jgi:hypothetical protein